jgi:hypothetical protein
MRSHHRPVDVGRDALEDFGVVAGFHVLEEGADLGGGWVGRCHFFFFALVFGLLFFEIWFGLV